MKTMNRKKRCLVTGVTGYIGGRLVPELLDKGYEVRVVSRDVFRLQGRAWIDRVEAAEADMLKPETMSGLMKDIDIAYYLIHSMSGNEDSDFHERDIRAAKNFGDNAKACNIERIIYLGGLGSDGDTLSRHLKSRQITGETLRKSGIPVTEFRAAVVVGSGSKSFEMIRYLTERLPVMICPRWVYSKVQPISISDVLQYMTEAIEKEETANEIIEIGGRDIVTYAEMMKTYAKVNGLKRLLISVPVLTPGLSSYWVHWMTPIPASLARPLIEGLKNDVVVEDKKSRMLFPDISPVSYEKSVEMAMHRIDLQDVETTWNDALLSSRGDEPPVVLETKQGMHIERRIRRVHAGQQEVFKTFCSLGGAKGWLTYQWAWKLRGMLDRLAGGVGFRRGRRSPSELRVGDVLDFWRVEAVKDNELLRLRAEMKLPGSAWLEFQTVSEDGESAKLVQTAYFSPRGLLGLIYWYGLYPFHALIFSSMIEHLAKEAERTDH